MTRLVVIAAAHQMGVVTKLRECVDGLVLVWRPRRPTSQLPWAPNLDQAITSDTDGVLMMTPSSNLAEDVHRCQTGKIPILAAGPLPNAAKGHDPVWQHDGQWRRLLSLRQRPAFGSCVFYRRVSGGGAAGLMQTWWTLWEASQEAQMALAAPIASARLNVHRLGARRGWHTTLHLLGSDGSHAQLVVTPQPDAQHVERMLVGTGGTLSSEAMSAGTTLVSATGVDIPQAIDTNPLWRWTQVSLTDPGFADPVLTGVADDGSLIPFTADQLLRMIRRGARQGTTITLA